MGGNMTKPQIDAAIYDPAFMLEDAKLDELLASLGKMPQFAQPWAKAKEKSGAEIAGGIGAAMGAIVPLSIDLFAKSKITRYARSHALKGKVLC